MKVFIVYAHPSRDSFTREARDSFIRGLESGGHSWVLSGMTPPRCPCLRR